MTERNTKNGTSNAILEAGHMPSRAYNSQKYIAIGADGSGAHGVEEDDAAVLELEQLSPGSYQIKLTGTKSYLEHPNINSTQDGHTLLCVHVKFTDKVPLQRHTWRFERIGDDTNGFLKSKSTSTPQIPQPNRSNLLSPNSSSLYPDDAHFYTDLLFNMPRTPFTRTQRIAALDWARKLGATNVPTMEWFDECERRLEVAPESDNNPGQNDEL
ncbi:hypothetical protein OPQ81_011503 [Rhizoctonia solani]|nr:hypothetical protein OPQ81_011503 [Rhizoctonia solani]